MTAKQYLRQAYRLDELINSNLRELERLRELTDSVQGVKYDGVRVAGGKAKNDSQATRIVEKIIDLENKINADIDRYVNLKATIRAAIDALPNRDEQMVMRYRYFDCMSWEKIAEVMNYSVAEVYRTRAEALKHFTL